MWHFVCDELWFIIRYLYVGETGCYRCKVLKPSNGKNPEEPKNDKYVSKTYTFDVTKCDEIFNLLVAEGIMVVPKGLKMSPIEQRKKRRFL